VPQVTIREITTIALQEFIDAQKQFSAHDITVSVRGLVAKHDYTLEGVTSSLIVDGKKTARITHEMVRGFVVEHMQGLATYSTHLQKVKDGDKDVAYKRYIPVTESSKPLTTPPTLTGGELLDI
jgi:hypothetical protein